MKEVLEGLAGLLNKPAEEVATLFAAGENGAEALKPTPEVLNTLKGWVKERTDDIYKAAQRKKAQEFEAAIKAKGVTADGQGAELIDALFEFAKGKAGSSSDPSEWEKKYNDLSPKLENLQRALTEKEAAIEQARREGEGRVVAARLESDLRRALGPKWAGTDEHFTLIRAQFQADRIKYDGDTPTLLNDKGEPLTDELHRPVKFSDRVQALGKLAGGFHAVDPGKGGAGNRGGGTGGTGGGITLKDGMDGREFQTLLSRESDPDKRSALLEARKAQLEKK